MFTVIANNDASDMLVEASEDGETIIQGKIPQELWEDEVGDDASAQKRLKWATDNSANILDALVAQHIGSGFVKNHFERIIFTGVKDAH